MQRNIIIAAVLAAILGLAWWFTGRPAGETAASASKPALVSGVHLDALDRNTRPQDDFYRFVNGGWLDATQIPEIYAGYTVYHTVYEDAEKVLREIIEDAAANPGAPGSEQRKVGDFYATWMDEAAIEAAGISPIESELALVNAIDDRESLALAIAELSRLGVTMPYSQYVWQDLKNSEQYAFYLSQDGLTLPNRDYYVEKDNERFATARDALPGYAAGLLAAAGWPRAKADAAGSKIYALEERIAEAHWTAVQNRDPQAGYNPYTLDELDALGDYAWTGTLTELGVVEKIERVIIDQPSYFEALGGMLHELPLEDWKAYLAYHVLDSRASHLGAAFDNLRFNYRNKLVRGQQEQQPRWKRGVSLVDDVLGEAVGKIYVERAFPPEAKAKMEALVANVIAAFETSIEELEWMTPATREQAKAKLAKFSPKIGYPDVWKDYSDLVIERGDHMGNLRRAIAWNWQQDIDKLGGPIDRTEWGMTPQTVNAYYSPTKNEIVFPAARLQPPFFQLNADDAINYGAVGGVIGHEISHGFDDKGSQYDGNGNLENWWTDEDRAKFEKLTKVLVGQFNAYEPLPGMHINGELTLGENIGDLSGVAVAYKAYIASLNGKEPPVIDGFTGPQRFFIGYAMSRKGKYTEEAIAARLASDPHSPLRYRVNGIYRNLDAFHEAFNTKPGDGMWLSPEERVRIW
ncbi:MAG TPA: M13-type metalloendopeptidase [Gammaproteobacteria bacterium]